MTYNVFGGTLNLAQFNSSGMQGWVAGLHTEVLYPPEDGHPSKY